MSADGPTVGENIYTRQEKKIRLCVSVFWTSSLFSQSIDHVQSSVIITLSVVHMFKSQSSALLNLIHSLTPWPIKPMSSCKLALVSLPNHSSSYCLLIRTLSPGSPFKISIRYRLPLSICFKPLISIAYCPEVDLLKTRSFRHIVLSLCPCAYTNRLGHRVSADRLRSCFNVIWFGCHFKVPTNRERKTLRSQLKRKFNKAETSRIPGSRWLPQSVKSREVFDHRGLDFCEFQSHDPVQGTSLKSFVMLTSESIFKQFLTSELESLLSFIWSLPSEQYKNKFT